MFMVNNIGFKGCKSEKTGCRNLLAVAVGGLQLDLMDYLVGRICEVIQACKIDKKKKREKSVPVQELQTVLVCSEEEEEKREENTLGLNTKKINIPLSKSLKL